MGATFNGAQFFGELAPNLYVAAGYNGVGIAMGTISGVLLADLALGADSPLLADMRALPQPDGFPRAGARRRHPRDAGRTWRGDAGERRPRRASSEGIPGGVHETRSRPCAPSDP